MIKGPKLRLKAIAPRMVQKTLRELRVLRVKIFGHFSLVIMKLLWELTLNFNSLLFLK